MKRRFTFTGSIRSKLIAMTSILLILPILVIGFVSYQIATTELNKKGEVILKNSVEQVLQLIDSKQDEIKMGNKTLEEAQEEVKVYLLGKKNSSGKRSINKNIDLGENGYFVVYDENGLEIAHPSLEGKNVWNVEDKSGKGFMLVQEQIKAALSGGGFVYYTWTLPNSEKIGEKISYQEQDPHWGWIVSAGSYMQDYNKGSSAILKALIFILVGVTALGLIAIILFSKHISEPIKVISNNLEDVSRGNLKMNELNISNNDETGKLAQSFNSMVRNMKGLISTIQESSLTVMKFSDSLETITTDNSRAINEVTTTIQEVAQAVGEEAISTDNAVSKIDILANNIETVTNFAINMDQVTTETVHLSNNGLSAIDTLTETTEKNNIATNQFSEVITKVNDSSNKINLITESITEISQQTNLLALNASIEAARAGEAGKGFAVVADEIRKLAEQSEKAVNEIKNIIDDIHKYSSSSVETMKTVKNATNDQNTAVSDTKHAFKEISGALNKLTISVNEINKESLSMRNMKNEIVGIMENISASTQQTSAATEEVSASSEEQLASIEEVLNYAHELKLLSTQLKQAVEQFSI